MSETPVNPTSATGPDPGATDQNAVQPAEILQAFVPTEIVPLPPPPPPPPDDEGLSPSAFKRAGGKKRPPRGGRRDLTTRGGNEIPVVVHFKAKATEASELLVRFQKRKLHADGSLGDKTIDGNVVVEKIKPDPIAVPKDATSALFTIVTKDLKNADGYRLIIEVYPKDHPGERKYGAYASVNVTQGDVFAEPEEEE